MTENLANRIAYGQALAELGRDHDFVVMDADLSKATQTYLFAQAYPHRFFNFGISEGDMMSTAAGMASCKKTVFVSTFALFGTGRAYEQIRNSIAYPNLNVKICCTHGGLLIGEDGATHQSFEDIGLMRSLPNMKVIVPCDQYETAAAMQAVLNTPGPCYVRFGRAGNHDVYETLPPFEIGKANLLKAGNDAALIATGEMVYETLKASEFLKQKGIQAAVVDMHTIKPLDKQMLLTLGAYCNKFITIEDHSILNGLGSSVAEVIAEHGLGKLKRIGIHDVFGRSGTRADLQQTYGLNAETIVKTAEAFVKEGL